MRAVLQFGVVRFLVEGETFRLLCDEVIRCLAPMVPLDPRSLCLRCSFCAYEEAAAEERALLAEGTTTQCAEEATEWANAVQVTAPLTQLSGAPAATRATTPGRANSSHGSLSSTSSNSDTPSRQRPPRSPSNPSANMYVFSQETFEAVEGRVRCYEEAAALRRARLATVGLLSGQGALLLRPSSATSLSSPPARGDDHLQQQQPLLPHAVSKNLVTSPPQALRRYPLPVFALDPYLATAGAVVPAFDENGRSHHRRPSVLGASTSTSRRTSAAVAAAEAVREEADGHYHRNGSADGNKDGNQVHSWKDRAGPHTRPYLVSQLDANRIRHSCPPCTYRSNDLEVVKGHEAAKHHPVPVTASTSTATATTADILSAAAEDHEDDNEGNDGEWAEARGLSASVKAVYKPGSDATQLKARYAATGPNTNAITISAAGAAVDVHASTIQQGCCRTTSPRAISHNEEQNVSSDASGDGAEDEAAASAIIADEDVRVPHRRSQLVQRLEEALRSGPRTHDTLTGSPSHVGLGSPAQRSTRHHNTDYRDSSGRGRDSLSRSASHNVMKSGEQNGAPCTPLPQQQVPNLQPSGASRGNSICAGRSPVAIGMANASTGTPKRPAATHTCAEAIATLGGEGGGPLPGGPSNRHGSPHHARDASNDAHANRVGSDAGVRVAPAGHVIGDLLRADDMHPAPLRPLSGSASVVATAAAVGAHSSGSGLRLPILASPSPSTSPMRGGSDEGHRWETPGSNQRTVFVPTPLLATRREGSR